MRDRINAGYEYARHHWRVIHVLEARQGMKDFPSHDPVMRRSFASRRGDKALQGRGCPGQHPRHGRACPGHPRSWRTEDLGQNQRHGRACPGHPRSWRGTVRTWMPGTGPGMTNSGARKYEDALLPGHNGRPSSPHEPQRHAGRRRSRMSLCSSGLRRGQRQRHEYFLRHGSGLSRPSTFFARHGGRGCPGQARA